MSKAILHSKPSVISRIPKFKQHNNVSQTKRYPVMDRIHKIQATHGNKLTHFWPMLAEPSVTLSPKYRHHMQYWKQILISGKCESNEVLHCHQNTSTIKYYTGNNSLIFGSC